jgi:hypothetical protein
VIFALGVVGRSGRFAEACHRQAHQAVIRGLGLGGAVEEQRVIGVSPRELAQPASVIAQILEGGTRDGVLVSDEPAGC